MDMIYLNMPVLPACKDSLLNPKYEEIVYTSVFKVVSIGIEDKLRLESGLKRRTIVAFLSLPWIPNTRLIKY